MTAVARFLVSCAGGRGRPDISGDVALRSEETGTFLDAELKDAMQCRPALDSDEELFLLSLIAQ